MEEMDISEPDDTVRPIIRKGKDKTVTMSQKSRTSGQQRQVAVHSSRAMPETKEVDFVGGSTAPHLMMAAAALHISYHTVKFPVVSTFIPNCFVMFEILSAMHKTVCENTYLYRVAPDYLTILSRAYYSVLWFIHILRARQAVGNLTSKESSFVRRFERSFPFESLPIAGPLVMYFSSLGAVKTDDPMYNWICPALPAALGPTKASDATGSNYSRILYPWFPAIISLFHSIRNSTNITTSMNDNEEFIPFNIEHGGTFAGITFPPVTQTTQHETRIKNYLLLQGINKAPEQLLSTLKRVQPLLRRMQSVPVISPETDLSDISSFLLMAGDANWFHSIIAIATKEASFFKSTTKFSDISPTVGLSTLVGGKPDKLDSTPPRPTDWYPGLGFKIEANYRTTRGQTSDMDFQIGVANSIIFSVPEGFNEFSRVGGKSTGDLTGDYWKNKIYQIETPIPEETTPHLGNIVRLEFYEEEGTQLSTRKKD